ncbi:MAG: extracellular solute-binding protein [Clostridia bacterium]|nr:extracellular solute-binding protein [Clostridia bacterium]
MKKLLSLVLALLMVMSLLSISASADDKVVIEFWHTHAETFGGPAVQRAIEAFNANNDLGVEIRSMVFTGYDELNTNLQSAIAGNNAPVISTCSYSNINYMAQNFPYVSPVEIIEKYFPEDKDYLANKYDPAILNLGVSVDGKQFGLPYGLSVPLLYYNADILDAAGLDKTNLPETWEEVGEWAKTIVEKTGLQGLYIQLPTDTYSIIPMYLGAGLDSMYKTNEDGSYTADFVNEGTIYNWTKQQEWYKNGYAVYMTNTEGRAAMAAGLLGMYLTTSARIQELTDAEPNFVSSMHPYWEGHDRVVCLGGNVLVIWAQEEFTQKVAWTFIKWLLEAENVADFDNGTGYVPPTKDVTEEMYTMLSNPLLGDNINERADALPWTSWPGKNGVAIDRVLITARDAIINDYVDVATALQSAQDEINELLK